MFDWVLNMSLWLSVFYERKCLQMGWCQRHLIDLTAKIMIVSWEMQLRNFLFNTYKYFNMKVCQQTNNVKDEYVNIHHWEFDLSSLTEQENISTDLKNNIKNNKMTSPDHSRSTGNNYHNHVLESYP